MREYERLNNASLWSPFFPSRIAFSELPVSWEIVIEDTAKK